jgi:hypothetical protein
MLNSILGPQILQVGAGRKMILFAGLAFFKEVRCYQEISAIYDTAIEQDAWPGNRHSGLKFDELAFLSYMHHP